MIKTLFIGMAIALILGACTNSESYKITVNTNQHKDKTAYLIRFENNQPVVIDSATWDNGFKFQGEIKTREMVYFQWSGINENTSFFLDNGEITIHLKDNTAEIGSIEGSELNTKHIAFLDSANQFTKMNQELYGGYQKAQAENNEKALDSIRTQADILYNKEQAFAKRAAHKNMENVLGLYIMRSKLAHTLDYNALNEALSTVPDNNKNNPYYKYLAEHLKKLSLTRVGQIAPDFTMKDTAGNDISLKDFRGNYIMIDFWASWCGPCRRANPYVVEIFKEFNPKGFQILGVSFDKSQQAWIEAIHDDHLTWPHVSDLQGWKNAAGQLYGINSIPHTTLIDPDGKIVANRFEHEELRILLEEIYK